MADNQIADSKNFYGIWRKGIKLMGAFLFFCQDLMGVAASRAGTWNPQPINGNKKRNLSLLYHNM